MKKHLAILWMSVITFVILIMGGTIFLLQSMREEESACRFYFGNDIVLRDGVLTVNEEAGKEENVFRFRLSKDTEYRLHVAWKEESGDILTAAAPGFLTCMVLRDEQENPVAYCSGGWADIEIEPGLLKAGEYTAQFGYFTDEKAFRECMKDLAEGASLKEGSYKGYESFGKEGTWRVEYTFELEEKNELSHQSGLRLGVLFGVVLGLLGSAILIILTKKDNSLKAQYDERQEFYRGRAFKYGFFTILIYYGILTCCSIAEIPPFMEKEVELMVGIILGVMVFGGYSIWNDAYFCLNDKKGEFLIIFSLIGLMNILVGISNLRNRTMFADGRLTFHSLCLMTGIMFLFLLLMVLFRVVLDRKDRSE